MAEDSRPPKPYIPPESNEETRLYWDRLDAKFANLQSTPRPAAPETPAEPPTPTGAESAAPTAHPAASATGLIAQAFSALLALEDGQPDARPVRLTIGDGHPKPPAEPKITDEIIDDIVRRVIQRMGPEAVRTIVTEVVSEVAERLVREEIDRIRKQHV